MIRKLTFSLREQFSRIDRASPYFFEASSNLFSLKKAFPRSRSVGTAASCSASSICHISFSYSSGWNDKRQRIEVLFSLENHGLLQTHQITQMSFSYPRINILHTQHSLRSRSNGYVFNEKYTCCMYTTFIVYESQMSTIFMFNDHLCIFVNDRNSSLEHQSLGWM